jgi:hypothetical protein
LAQYLFQVIRFDYSLTVRRHVGRAVSESILMTLAVGEVYMNITPSNPHVTENIELSPEQREQREKERESEQGKIVKAVRKEFNGKPELREIVQSAPLPRSASVSVLPPLLRRPLSRRPSLSPGQRHPNRLRPPPLLLPRRSSWSSIRPSPQRRRRRSTRSNHSLAAYPIRI